MRKMKTRFLLCSAALPVTALLALAADTPDKKPDQNDPSTRTYERARAVPSDRLGNTAKASDIIGADIKDTQDEEFGKVTELAVDLESGRVVHVIISSGGILGLGDRTLAVPPQALTSGEKAWRLNFDKEKLKEAPAFEISQWDENYQSNRVAESYRFYGRQPYFQDLREGTRAASVDPSGLGPVEKASKVIGIPVQNLQDEKLGKVENLILDLPAGRIVHVVISSGGFLGLGDQLSAVPPTAFRYNEAREILQLDSTKDALAKAPRFNSKEWPDFNDPAYSSGVYQAYGLEPYFDTNVVAGADNTRLNVRDRQGDSLTPIDQGASDSDLHITRSIRRNLALQTDLSVNARNVKIITVNGRVTLRGPVNSEKERRLIADIANGVAGANVDNQLEVQQDEK